jgi:hypothetical protein
MSNKVRWNMKKLKSKKPWKLQVLIPWLNKSNLKTLTSWVCLNKFKKQLTKFNLAETTQSNWKFNSAEEMAEEHSDMMVTLICLKKEWMTTSYRPWFQQDILEMIKKEQLIDAYH